MRLFVCLANGVFSYVLYVLSASFSCWVWWGSFLRSVIIVVFIVWSALYWVIWVCVWAELFDMLFIGVYVCCLC